jgi:hypothetical protein
MTNEAIGQYKGWPRRVVREMATHFPNSALAEISLNNSSEVEAQIIGFLAA